MPLSFAQQRLWFIEQLEPGAAVYNIPIAVRLTGELNVSALEQSIREIVRRHEVLRIRFEESGGEVLQLVGEVVEIHMGMWDLSGVASEDELDRHIRKISVDEGRKPFDLGAGGQIRAKLLRVAEREHLLLVTMHHIVSDGWSIGVMLTEISELYSWYRERGYSEKPELEIQYGDYSVWQREWMESDGSREQKDYWTHQLKGLGALELPSDRARPPVATHRGARQRVRLTPNLTQGLKEMSRREGVTLFMSLLGGFQLLLARYTGQQDIAVGIPIAGRTRRQTEGLIGNFVNTLVMRTQLSGNPTVRELLGRVRETSLGAYGHQELPFEKVVEELEPERTMSHEPLFQVMLVLQNAIRGPRDVSGLSISSEPIKLGTAKFDVTLTLGEVQGSLEGWIEYATDLFESLRIERMIGHLSRLLEGFAANRESRVMDLGLLSKEEWEQVVVEWNRTSLFYDAEKGVAELIQDQVKIRPEAVAVEYDNQNLSYRELNERTNQVGRYLRKLGVEPEKCVGLCLERSLEMVIGLLGVVKSGIS
jgi:hypothetical protein